MAVANLAISESDFSYEDFAAHLRYTIRRDESNTVIEDKEIRDVLNCSKEIVQRLVSSGQSVVPISVCIKAVAIIGGWLYDRPHFFPTGTTLDAVNSSGAEAILAPFLRHGVQIIGRDEVADRSSLRV